ncbi:MULTISPECIES: nitrate reductase cytochrome c-type subunit [Roseibium]|uniref:nitrate reductase cytochrome c-type subunit n=1 Tax=Roseibium TaxID=150830 RepID=UPI001E2FF9F0|nr:nitrate reductase cytochrome c-type subunit [Roseibium aggregatum]UES50575.1 nitrate reductase cytochrome c-type subunit; periplasmic nitrate reductase electron transfer subunit [Roseibium aggregatum]
MKRFAIGLACAALLVAAAAATAQEHIATMRPATPLAENGTPAPMPKPVNSDIRQVRNYPEQPPLIPHTIEGYQIDKNSNKCLSCHSRTAIEVSQAPMVSITHFMNRDNQFLASVTPRRYFCNQCHVPQTDARPLVENDFVDVDEVLEYVKSKEGAK